MPLRSKRRLIRPEEDRLTFTITLPCIIRDWALQHDPKQRKTPQGFITEFLLNCLRSKPGAIEDSIEEEEETVEEVIEETVEEEPEEEDEPQPVTLSREAQKLMVYMRQDNLRLITPPDDDVRVSNSDNGCPIDRLVKRSSGQRYTPSIKGKKVVFARFSRRQSDDVGILLPVLEKYADVLWEIYRYQRR